MGLVQTIGKLRNGQPAAASVSSFSTERCRVAQAGGPATASRARTAHGLPRPAAEGATPSAEAVESGRRRGDARLIVGAAAARSSAADAV